MTIVTSYISRVVGEGTKNKLILPNSNPPFMQQTLLFSHAKNENERIFLFTYLNRSFYQISKIVLMEDPQ